MPKQKGLLVRVYRTPGADCTNGGVTSRYNMALLVGDDVPQVTEAGELPVLQLVRERVIGVDEYLKAVPLELMKKHSLPGGNFIYTEDGRFPNWYPLPVWDREE